MTRDDEWITAVFERERWHLPPRPGEVEHIVARVAHRRRRRVVLRSVVLVSAGAVLAGTTLFVVQREADTAGGSSGFLSQPRTSGEVPEPKIRHIASPAQIGDLLPGAAVTPVAVSGGFDVEGVAPSGELIGQTAHRWIELRRPDGTRTRRIARADLPVVTGAYANESLVVWGEASEGFNDPDRSSRARTVWRCFDRRTGDVRELKPPRKNQTGADYARWLYRPGLVGQTIVAGLTVETWSGDQNITDVSDIYVAEGCNSPFRVLETGARSAQVAGDWLYYLHASGLWRRPISMAGPGGSAHFGAPQPVAEHVGERGFAATNDAVVFQPSLSNDIAVARPDGSLQRSIPTGQELKIPTGQELNVPVVAATSALAGVIGTSSQSSPDWVRGIWVYLPSRGAIIAMDSPQLAPLAAAGDYLLIAEYPSPTSGPPARAWLVKPP